MSKQMLIAQIEGLQRTVALLIEQAKAMRGMVGVEDETSDEAFAERCEELATTEVNYENLKSTHAALIAQVADADAIIARERATHAANMDRLRQENAALIALAKEAAELLAAQLAGRPGARRVCLDLLNRDELLAQIVHERHVRIVENAKRHERRKGP